MFSNELDHHQHPLVSRSRGIVLGSIVVIAIVAALISARTLAVSYWIVAGSFAVTSPARTLTWARQAPSPLVVCLGAFLGYALLSLLWSEVPSLVFDKVGVAFLIVLSARLLNCLVEGESRSNLLHIGEGLCIGVAIGLLYLFLELSTDHAIKLWLYRSLGLGRDELQPGAFFIWREGLLVGIAPTDLNRNIVPAVLFLFPALLALKGIWGRAWHRGWVLILLLGTAAVVFMSEHESSKLALIGSLVVYGCAARNRERTARVLSVCWVGASLAFLPAALLAHRLDLHHSRWLGYTARHRVIIWNFTAEKSLQRPLLGVGANMTYVLGPEIERRKSPHQAPSLETLSIHSHSVYLQTWFELGLVGAALLTLCGLSILSAIRSLAPAVQPSGYAGFAASAIMAATSYGMWQLWFIASFAMCAVLFSVAAAVQRPTSR